MKSSLVALAGCNLLLLAMVMVLDHKVERLEARAALVQAHPYILTPSQQICPNELGPPWGSSSVPADWGSVRVLD